MFHSITCLVALLSLFAVNGNAYYPYPRSQQRINRPRSDLREQLETQSQDNKIYPYPRYAHQFNSQVLHPQNQALVQDIQRQITSSMVSTQDISIQRCGQVGTDIQNILNTALGFVFLFFPNAVQVDIDCNVNNQGRCVSVRVEVPVGTLRADVNVCTEPGKCIVVYEYNANSLYNTMIIDGSVCTSASTPSAPSCLGITPLNIPILLPTGRTFTIGVAIDAISGCVAVNVNAPRCSTP